MQVLSIALIIAASLINLLPVSGVLSASRLEALYGLALRDHNLEILMRHRAALFGIVAGLLVASAFHTPLRPLAFAVGLLSMLSFVLIAWLVGGYNPELKRVLLADLVASAMLIGAALLDHLARTRAVPA